MILKISNNLNHNTTDIDELLSISGIKKNDSRTWGRVKDILLKAGAIVEIREFVGRKLHIVFDFKKLDKLVESHPVYKEVWKNYWFE